MAQGTITYGSATVTTLSPEAPIAIFTFQGAEDDQITLQAIGITPALDLSVTLQNGTEILLVADGDPFTAGSTDVRADYRLPATGVYLLLVSSPSFQTGDFLLKLSGQPQAERTVISGIPADVPITAGAISYYTYTGASGGANLLNLTASPDLQFLAVVRNSSGQIISTASGASTVLSLPDGDYEIALSGITSSMEGIVSITAGDLPTTTTELTLPPPVATEEIIDTTGECVVSTGGAVNVRSAPSTDDSVLTQILAGTTYPVIGSYNGWYQINVAGIGTGWVSATVVNRSGDCSNIPVVDPNIQPTSAPPTATPTTDTTSMEATPTFTPTATVNTSMTATFTPTYTPTQQNQATATFTPSYTPTTPPAAQIAPEDARFNNPLNIQLDNTASVLDFVSYPNGDTEDRVSWDIIGMNQNSSLSGGQARLVIAVSCFGTNTDQIQFFTGGQTYSCGQTIVDTTVTAASKTGSVIITAIGGTDTYVQWVLTGTATRTN